MALCGHVTKCRSSGECVSGLVIKVIVRNTESMPGDAEATMATEGESKRERESSRAVSACRFSKRGERRKEWEKEKKVSLPQTQLTPPPQGL